MTRPYIGITVRRDGNDYALAQQYVQGVLHAGGIPILLCPGSDCIDLLHGIVFTGGGDFAPPSDENDASIPARLSDVDPIRDAYELALVQSAYERHLPILGICRGHQLINLALGGTLLYDIAAAGYSEPHALPPAGRHPISVPEETHLFHILSGKLFVNSHHHQAVATLANGLYAAAFSSAGIVEALENEPNTVLGVQWHPEKMEMSAIFNWIFDKAFSYLALQVQTV